eukprot:m.135323 g.135323  ORF g.135323 m.135323 type:complete len:245 (+) comp9904_c0_seq1:95-829(+)
MSCHLPLTSSAIIQPLPTIHPQWLHLLSYFSVYPYLFEESQKKMSKITLKYFDIPGRAEPVRIAFHAGNVEFEDKRIAFPDYPEVKKTLALGYLPELEIDGDVFTQFAAQLRYAGRFSNLYPSDPIAQLKADEIIEIAQELLYKAPRSEDKEEMKRLREEFAKTTLKKCFQYIEGLIEKRGNKFTGGDEISVGDLALMGIVGMIESGGYDFIPTNFFDDFKGVKAWYERVQADDVVASYYAKSK